MMQDRVRTVVCDPAMSEELRAYGLTTILLEETDPARRWLGPLEDLMIARWQGATHVILSPAEGSPSADPGVRKYLREHGVRIGGQFGGTLWQIPPPPPPGAPAVFCLGMTKTATTSLSEALGVLGIPCFHWGGQEAWRQVMDAFRAGDLLTSRLPQGWDGFADIGSLLARYRLLDVQYPGSRFILTVRDEDAWIDSRRRHVERNRRAHAAGHYQGTNLQIEEQAWRASWRSHLASVREYFAGRADLLELDLTIRPRWDELASFFDVRIPNVGFPAANINGRPSPAESARSGWRRFPRKVVPTSGSHS